MSPLSIIAKSRNNSSAAKVPFTQARRRYATLLFSLILKYGGAAGRIYNHYLRLPHPLLLYIESGTGLRGRNGPRTRKFRKIGFIREAGRRIKLVRWTVESFLSPLLQNKGY